MSAWYLLWMFVDVVALFAACVATPFLLSRALDSEYRALDRQLVWRIARRRQLEMERYSQPLRSCLYCGSQCEFGPNCANRDLSPARRANRKNEHLLREMPHLRERAAASLASLGPEPDPVKLLPCPCARCGKSATLLTAFQNTAGHIFCSHSCYRAGGEK